MRTWLLALAPLLGWLLAQGCAELRTGWARVTWVEGSIAPEVACSTRIGVDGDVEMVCTALKPVETDLLWKRERRRVNGGTL